MDYKKYGDAYLVRLDIGTTNHAKIGLLDTGTKVYYPMEYNEDLEITGINGTVSEMNDETYLHIHISLAKKDHSVVGGHLDFAYVSAVAEIFIRPVDGKTDREFSETAGVNLLQLK